MQTMLNCIDNSGATVVECIANMKMKRAARIGTRTCTTNNYRSTQGTPGDRIIVVVQKSRNLGETGPSSGAGPVTAAKVRRGDIRHAIVVRTAKKVQRPDGMVVKFDDNACALIGKNGEPIGTRINVLQHHRYALQTCPS
ncbi:MAG: hypothetical protein LQ338_000295 [Usnochroma carphineum]|nr:MAG: hypothetical protein LQ338_000295 [Usnochroma carphineum]